MKNSSGKIGIEKIRIEKITDNHISKDFPILKNDIHYLDNAATTQKPQIVIDTLKWFYENSNANTHRGIYKLSEKATSMLEDSRKTFAKFINADPSNLIFVKGATEGFNQLANSIERTLVLKEKNIVVTVMEHHSNFLPWQQLCKRNDIEFRVVPLTDSLDLQKSIGKYIDEDTLLVAFTGMSNVTGQIFDVKKIVKQIRSKNRYCISVVDAAQLAAHGQIDVKDFDCDALCFSAHKIYGTTGVGLLFMKDHLLKNLEPFFFGGNMITSVSIKDSVFADIPDKFEAGTIDTAGIVASAKAISYLKEVGFKRIAEIENNLKAYALKRLGAIKGLKIIGHRSMKDYGPLISFTVEGIHPHDLSSIADESGVCIRAGHHCAQPLMKALGVNATSRISLSFYNSKEDIDVLVSSILRAQEMLVK